MEIYKEQPWRKKLDKLAKEFGFDPEANRRAIYKPSINELREVYGEDYKKVIDDMVNEYQEKKEDN